MSPRAIARLSWSLWTVVLLLAVMQVSLLVVDWNTHVPGVFAFRGWQAALAVPLATCAAVVTVHRPANPIGWLLFVGGLAIAASGAASEYAVRAVLADPGSLPGGVYAAWLASWISTPVVLIVAPGLLLFPDGHLPSPRWRPVAWLCIPGMLWLSAGVAFYPGPLQEAAYVDNPLAGLPVGTGFWDLAFAGELLLLVPICALGPVIRYRHAGVVERQQLKWLGMAGLLWASLQLPVLILGTESGLTSKVAEFAFVFAMLAFPFAITIAIVRYHLYDIDRIINRTLVYGALTLATVGSYALLVVAFSWAVQSVAGQGSNELAVAATTLIVAAMFQPARRRIQSLVDRRFYRSRYDAERTLEAFQERLRHETDLDSLRQDLVSVATGALRPAHISLWLRKGEVRS